MDFKEWVPDEAVESLTVRRALAQVEDPISIASDLFKENLPLAVMAMSHLAIHSPVEQVRYHASKYVIDRAMGDAKVGLRPHDERPTWERIYDGVLTEANKLMGDDK